ncbi:hypothetical protein D3C81_1761270 [compost metagenome]
MKPRSTCSTSSTGTDANPLFHHPEANTRPRAIFGQRGECVFTGFIEFPGEHARAARLRYPAPVQQPFDRRLTAQRAQLQARPMRRAGWTRQGRPVIEPFDMQHAIGLTSIIRAAGRQRRQLLRLPLCNRQPR